MANLDKNTKGLKHDKAKLGIEVDELKLELDLSLKLWMIPWSRRSR